MVKSKSSVIKCRKVIVGLQLGQVTLMHITVESQ